MLSQQGAGECQGRRLTTQNVRGLSKSSRHCRRRIVQNGAQDRVVLIAEAHDFQYGRCLIIIASQPVPGSHARLPHAPAQAPPPCQDDAACMCGSGNAVRNQWCRIDCDLKFETRRPRKNQTMKWHSCVSVHVCTVCAPLMWRHMQMLACGQLHAQIPVWRHTQTSTGDPQVRRQGARQIPMPCPTCGGQRAEAHHLLQHPMQGACQVPWRKDLTRGVQPAGAGCDASSSKPSQTAS
jgi:hypothetical protein